MKKFWFGAFLCLILFLSSCSKTEVSIVSDQNDQLISVTTPIPKYTITTTATTTTTPTITTTPFLPATPTITQTSTETLDPHLVQTGPGSFLCPILLYHHVLVNNSSGTEYTVTVDQFRSQMQWLKENGYQTISVQDMVDTIHDGKVLPIKPIIITFDDGNEDIYNNAYPILQEMGFTATMYLISEAIGDYGNFTENEIQELSSAGWEFGSHSRTHANLNTTPDRTDEICGSKNQLMELLNIPINSFAYPYGIENDRAMNIAFGCGYTSGAGLGSYTIQTQSKLFYFSRREIKSYFDMQRFITTVTDLR